MTQLRRVDLVLLLVAAVWGSSYLAAKDASAALPVLLLLLVRYAISAAGAFRTDDGGATWTPINQGLRSEYIPDPNAEVGHCVHHVSMHPAKPDVLFMQKHWDVMRSDNAGDKWYEVSGNLPTDFGFVIDRHPRHDRIIVASPCSGHGFKHPAALGEAISDLAVGGD